MSMYLGQPNVSANCQSLMGHDVSDWDFWKRRSGPDGPYTDADLDCASSFAQVVTWTNPNTGEVQSNLIAGTVPGSPAPTEPDAAEQLAQVLNNLMAAAGGVFEGGGGVFEGGGGTIGGSGGIGISGGPRLGFGSSSTLLLIGGGLLLLILLMRRK